MKLVVGAVEMDLDDALSGDSNSRSHPEQGY